MLLPALLHPQRVAAASMESVFRHVLKSIFDDFVTGLDDNIECTNSSVKLWDLNLKGSKIHEMFEECCATPVEFMAGVIGSVQMSMSWRGEIEVVASDVVLKLNFTPVKALKEALLPSQPVEGFVHRVPTDIRRPEHWKAVLSGSPSPTQPVPRYCPLHFRPRRREKGPVRSTQCERCLIRLQTNYTQCRVCAPCSIRENVCMLCAEAASGDGRADGVDGFVHTISDLRQPEYISSVLNGTQPPYQAPPRYCNFHGKPENRKHSAVRLTQCSECKVRLQTNYEEVVLCSRCSDKECRCLHCGAYMPPGEEPVWEKLARQQRGERRRRRSADAPVTAGDDAFADISDPELQKAVRNVLAGHFQAKQFRTPSHNGNNGGSVNGKATAERRRLPVEAARPHDDKDPNPSQGITTPRQRQGWIVEEGMEVPLEEHRATTTMKTPATSGASIPREPLEPIRRADWDDLNSGDVLLVPPPPPSLAAAGSTSTLPLPASSSSAPTMPSPAAGPGSMPPLVHSASTPAVASHTSSFLAPLGVHHSASSPFLAPPPLARLPSGSAQALLGPPNPVEEPPPAAPGGRGGGKGGGRHHAITEEDDHRSDVS